MKVLKFGGSSVANAKNIEKVKDIAEKNAKNDKIAVVVSALGGVTDLLLETAKLAVNKNSNYCNSLKEIEDRHFNTIKSLIPIHQQSEVLSTVKQQINALENLLEGIFLIGELSDKTSDKVVSYGELLSSYIITKYFKSKGLNTLLKNSQELIITDNNFKNANVKFAQTNKNIVDYFTKTTSSITVLPGFVSTSNTNEITTLGRGGSDYTASIIAAALNAEELQIWTDVSGMYTANPNLVKQAFPIPHISYQEAMEMSHFGAKVIYPPTIQPVMKKEIPIKIKNTFSSEENGTLITKKTDNNNPVKGITHIQNITLITLEGSGMVGVTGISKHFFEALSEENINVILITQASSEHSICIGIYNTDAKKAEESINRKFSDEIEKNKINPVVVEQGLSIIALVGDNMKNYQGLSGQMFSVLGKNNVNIRAIAQGASEKNISAVINEKDIKKALNALHEQFFEDNIKQLNLFITGVGNVGNRFLAQIHQQEKYLLEQLKLKVRVIGISNSSKMYFNENGIDLEKWKELLEKGKSTSLESFFNKIKTLNLRNSVFVDNTANREVANMYIQYLKNSIAVVTCNKIACSSDLKTYKLLKKTAGKYNAPFLFETNVGAGLPIIDTLKNLILSGDRIKKIQAVLSGSLNFVFNNFKQSTTFSNIVQKAQKEGFTEPNPKIDLSGVDVARKILILARESGYNLELSDIENQSFLSEKSLSTTTNEDFYKALQKDEKHFQQLLKKTKEENCKLKYVAEFENGKAKVGLQHIAKNHPFYNLEGSDNIVLFFTDRYPVNPLQVKGAGAGADVTASGIFADVIRVANS